MLSVMIHSWCREDNGYSPATSSVALRRAMRVERRAPSMLCVFNLFGFWEVAVGFLSIELEFRACVYVCRQHNDFAEGTGEHSACMLPLLKLDHSLKRKQEADIIPHYCAHPNLDPTTSSQIEAVRSLRNKVLVVPDYTC